MKFRHLNLRNNAIAEAPGLSANRGFTLVEIAIASTIMMMVIAALFATVLTALKIYYLSSDHIQAGGESRRLVDDLIETGTFASDLKVFRDITDTTTVINNGERGDALIVFNRDIDGTGNILNFTCYYLKSASTKIDEVATITLWRKEGATVSASGETSTPTNDPAVALATYKGPERKVSSTILTGMLPRGMASDTNRPGIFTYIFNGGLGDYPSVLANFPTTMLARTPTLAASSSVTVSISPRH